MKESGTSTHAEYCAVNELPGDDCLNFMVYTLVKAVEDIESRLGTLDFQTNNWRFGKLNNIRKEHSPLTETPLRYFFDDTQEGQGNRRTVNLNHDLPTQKERYEGSGGPIFRMISDYTDPTSVYVTPDNGVD